MFSSTLLTVALFAASAVQGVLATTNTAEEFYVDTPELVQCQDATVTWEARTGPYHVYLLDPEFPCEDELAYIGQVEGTSHTFPVPLPEGTRAQVYIEDATGASAWSGPITVARSGDNSCVLPDLLTQTPIATVSSPETTPATPATPIGTTTGTPNAETGEAEATPNVPVGPIGAANVGSNDLLDNAAPSSRHLSVSAVALGALTAFVAFTL